VNINKLVQDYFKDVTQNMKEVNDKIVDQLLEESDSGDRRGEGYSE
jgi:hypothetical protein